MNVEQESTVETRCPICQQSESVLEFSWEQYQLHRCNYCRLVYAWPQEVPAHLYEEAYEGTGNYSEYLCCAEEAAHGYVHLTWGMRNFLRSVSASGWLLDVGCSTGTFLQAAQQQGWHVSGLEISTRAAAIARSLTGALVTTCTIDKLEEIQQFDAITAWEVLEHVQDPLAFAQDMFIRLKAGGVLALSVPNWQSPWMRRSLKREHWPPYHLTFWERETMKWFLTRIGFVDVEVRAKAFAWQEEVGRRKWAYLPISLFRSIVLGHKGMHVFVLGRKP